MSMIETSIPISLSTMHKSTEVRCEEKHSVFIFAFTKSSLPRLILDSVSATLLLEWMWHVGAREILSALFAIHTRW